MLFWHVQWAAVTEICACHCKHHRDEHKSDSLLKPTCGQQWECGRWEFGIGLGGGGSLQGPNARTWGVKSWMKMWNTRPTFCVRDVTQCHWAGLLLREGYGNTVGVWKGVSKKGRVGDNALLVSAATTSETRIHGGRCVPSGLPLPVPCGWTGMTNSVDANCSWWGIIKVNGW